MKTMNRLGTGLAAVLMLGAVTIVSGPPAAAATTCSKGVSNNGHTATAYCTSTSNTTLRYRVKATFCTPQGLCTVRVGPPVVLYRNGGKVSSVTDNSGTTNINAVEWEYVPGS